MEVFRVTVQRILACARAKVASAIVESKALVLDSDTDQTDV